MIATSTTDVQAPPPPGEGEVAVAVGRWEVVALRRLQTRDSTPLTWTSGPLGTVASHHGHVVGTITRRRRAHPWILHLEGFTWWHPPTALIGRWHYTPGIAAANLREAKARLAQLVSDAHSIDLATTSTRR